MITVYGIKSCDTCRKALKWLEAEGLAHDFHDFRVQGLDADRVATFLDKLGVDALVNRRSTSWRALDDNARAVFDGDDKKLVSAALAENPTLIKRPVFDVDGKYLIGFFDKQK